MQEDQALATVEELAQWLPFVMDDDEEREANGSLESLSDDARFYGKSQWISAARAPRSVRNMVIKAAVRHMKNYDGFVTSRAGDETVGWTDRGEDAGSAYFTEREIRVLRQLAGNSGGGFHSLEITAWGNKTTTAPLVRDEHGFPLPLYVPGTEFDL